MQIKFTFLLLTICRLFTPLMAQHTSEISLSSSLLYNKADHDSYYLPFGKDKTWQFNISYAYPIQERLYLETYFSYSVRSNDNEGCFIGCYTGVPHEFFLYNNNEKVNSRKLGFQLAIRYHLIDHAKWVVAATLGGAPSYDLQKQKYYTDTPNEINDPYQIEALGKLSFRYNCFNQLYVELHCQSRYKLGEKDLYYKKWQFGPGLGIGLLI